MQSSSLTSDQTLLLYLAGIVALVVIVALLAAGIAISAAFKRAPQAISEVLRSLADRGSIIQLLTVGVIVSAIFALALLKTLEAPAAATALSGIAGYVLGGMSKRKPKGRTPRSVASDNDSPVK